MKKSISKISNIPLSIKPAEANISNLISDIVFTSNSVVATVKLKLQSTIRTIRILWGDTKVTILDFSKLVSNPTGPIEFLPNGYIRFKHAYDLPENKKSFNQFIIVIAENINEKDIRTQSLSITPRFKIYHTDISFRLLDKGDSILENSSEWNITTIYSSPGTIKPSRSYEFDIAESITPTPWITLSGSNHIAELTHGESMTTAINLKEFDFFANDLYYLYISIDVDSENKLVTKSSGIIEIKYYQNFELIRPIQIGIPPLQL